MAIDKTGQCIASDMLPQVAMGNVCYVIFVICTSVEGRKAQNLISFDGFLWCFWVVL